MRLRWILGLIILTLALALAACGGGDDEEENGGGDNETPAATKTVEGAETQKPAETPKATETAEAAEPSGGGGESLGDVPVYPGADKTGDYSGSDVPLPLLGEGLDTEEYHDAQWAVYETDDAADDVISFYKDKMPGNGWNEENWFETSLVEDAAWGGYTKNDGDNAAWVFITGTDDKTQIVLGTGSK